ncbi:MAG: hypothetical protein ACTSPQ_14665 [Candidatus Helarchaeota archaeon]
MVNIILNISEEILKMSIKNNVFSTFEKIMHQTKDLDFVGAFTFFIIVATLISIFYYYYLITYVRGEPLDRIREFEGGTIKKKLGKMTEILIWPYILMGVFLILQFLKFLYILNYFSYMFPEFNEILPIIFEILFYMFIIYSFYPLLTIFEDYIYCIDQVRKKYQDQIEDVYKKIVNSIMNHYIMYIYIVLNLLWFNLLFLDNYFPYSEGIFALNIYFYNILILNVFIGYLYIGFIYRLKYFEIPDIKIPNIKKKIKSMYRFNGIYSISINIMYILGYTIQVMDQFGLNNIYQWVTWINFEITFIYFISSFIFSCIIIYLSKKMVKKIKS